MVHKQHIAMYSKSEKRSRLIKLIHVARRDLKMADDTYRAILGGLELPASTAELTVPQMEYVLEHLKRCGFKVRSKSKSAARTKTGKPQRSRSMAHEPVDQKVRALWLFLHQLGLVKNPSEAALAAYVKRIAKVDALQWADGKTTLALIETMKKWAMRILPERVDEMAQQLSDRIIAGALKVPTNELGKLWHVVHIARARQTFDPMRAAYDALKVLSTSTGDYHEI